MKLEGVNKMTSIVILTFNKIAYTKKCIESIKSIESNIKIGGKI